MAECWEAWRSYAVAPDRLVVADDCSVVFTLHPGDDIDASKGCRSMMQEKFPLRYAGTHWMRYRFTIQLDPDGRTNETGDVLLAEWFQGSGSPVFSIHARSGNFAVRQNLGRVVEYIPATAFRAGNEFCVEARFTTEDSGRFLCWLNNELLCDYLGPTLLHEGGPVFIFGLYRPQWSGMAADQQRTITARFSGFEYGPFTPMGPAGERS